MNTNTDYKGRTYFFKELGADEKREAYDKNKFYALHDFWQDTTINTIAEEVEPTGIANLLPTFVQFDYDRDYINIDFSKVKINYGEFVACVIRYSENVHYMDTALSDFGSVALGIAEYLVEELSDDTIKKITSGEDFWDNGEFQGFKAQFESEFEYAVKECLMEEHDYLLSFEGFEEVVTQAEVLFNENLEIIND